MLTRRRQSREQFLKLQRNITTRSLRAPLPRKIVMDDKQEAATKLADSAGAQKTPSNEAKFEILNTLKRGLTREETGPSVNTDLANEANAMLKEGLPEEKLQEELNK